LDIEGNQVKTSDYFAYNPGYQAPEEAIHRRLKNVLLLNSAQGKYPRGADPWVKATLRAMESLAKKGVRVIASVGLSSWELTAFLAARLGMELSLIVPGREEGKGRDYFDRALSDLGLDREKTRPVFAGKEPGRGFYAARDRRALELAQIVYPISMRPGGRLETLLAGFSTAEKEVREDFSTKWSRRSWTPSYNFPMEKLNPKLKIFARGWLAHWTHTWPGAWPGEKPWEFYRDMLAGGQGYVRDARRTLTRIIGERLLRGSSWRMPQGESMVSFTASDPLEALGLMRWRKRYTRYSLEPYGLAFRKKSLESLGARPVRYLGPDDPLPVGDERLFSQSAGRKGNWTVEREWRLRGDLHLERFSREELVLITADSTAAGVFKADFNPPWEVVPLFI